MISFLRTIKSRIGNTVKMLYASSVFHSISADISPELGVLFGHARLTLLDIGARGGPLDQLHVLAPYARLCICEPDIEEAKKVEEMLRSHGRWHQVTSFPEALAMNRKEVTLHITEKPGLSSILLPNGDLLRKYHSVSGWDIARTVTVPSLSLDEAAQKYNFRDLSFIKLDTQGTELEILQSGSNTVLPSVLGIYIEAEFLEMYAGQPLFGDVHAFLSQKGFRLFDIKRTSLRRKSKARPVYSKRELAWSHNLYFREKNEDGSILSSFQKVQLACLAASFEFFDYAAFLLETPDVEAYLSEHEIQNSSEAIKKYSESFWRLMRKRLNWLEKRSSVGTISTDRKLER